MNKKNLKNNATLTSNTQSERIYLTTQRLFFRFSVLSAFGMWLFGVAVNIYPDPEYFLVVEYIADGFAVSWVIVSVFMFFAVRRHKRELAKSHNFAQPMTEEDQQLPENSEYIYEDPEEIKLKRAKKGFAVLITQVLIVYYSIFAVEAFSYGVENVVVYLTLLYFLEVIVFAAFALEPGPKINFKAMIGLYYLFLFLLLPSLVINVMDFSFLHVHYQKISNPKYISKAILTIVLGMIIEFVLLSILFIGLYRKIKPGINNQEII